MVRLSYVAKVTDGVLAAIVICNENSQISEADILDMVSIKYNGKQPLNGELSRAGKLIRREMSALVEKFYTERTISK